MLQCERDLIKASCILLAHQIVGVSKSFVYPTQWHMVKNAVVLMFVCVKTAFIYVIHRYCMIALFGQGTQNLAMQINVARGFTIDL